MNLQDGPEVKLPFYVRLASILLSIVLILFLMHEGQGIIIPLFYSLLIALLLLPMTNWLERHHFSRSAAAIVAILLFVLFVTGVFYFLGAQLYEFSRDLPEIGSRMQVWIEGLQAWIARRYHVDASHQLDYLNKAAMDFAKYASVVAQALLVAVGGFAIWTVFVFIFTYFILTHRRLIIHFLTSLFQAADRPRVLEVLSESQRLANSYVVGLLIEMVVVAVMNVGALLIFGIHYAFLLGILAAVLNVIPYFGIYSSIAISALVTLGNSSPQAAITLIIILLVIHFIDANMLTPWIIGRRVKMNPLITLVAVLAGNLLWGISGMFLFIPLVGILKIIFARVDGFVPWAILMGTEEDDPSGPFQTNLKDEKTATEERGDS